MISLFHKLIWSPLEKELNKILNNKKHIIYLCVILLAFFFSSFMNFLLFISQVNLGTQKKNPPNKNP
jgi:hypothetical protein